MKDRTRAAGIIAEPALYAVIRILDDNIRYRLGLGLVDRFPDPDTCIEPVVHLNRADLYAVPAAIAGRFVNETGMLFHRYGKVTHRSLDLFNFCAGVQGNIFVPLDIDHLGGEDTHRAVICRKCLIELRHMPSD